METIRTWSRVFYDLLRPDGLYGRYFQHVLFAIYSRAHEQPNYTAFASQFASLVV